MKSSVMSGFGYKDVNSLIVVGSSVHSLSRCMHKINVGKIVHLVTKTSSGFIRAKQVNPAQPPNVKRLINEDIISS